ncbi:PaaI family thioesterase [Carnobacterium divergens]|uniref:PaaI family thioesterase n=1 Tax=Carnobacterium divergens TaxID=2748 RepID=UPI0039B02BF7
MNLLTELGIVTKRANQEEVQLTLEITEQHQQPFGLMHGGISGILIETAASIGANTYLDTTQEVAVGLELNLNHLASFQKGHLIVTATPIHTGKQTHVWQAVVSTDTGKKISVGRCTLMIQRLG